MLNQPPSDSLFSEEFLFVNPPIPSLDASAVISYLCDQLCERGYVDSSYAASVMEREQQYPTGLPTLPYGVALPHADNHAVTKTVVAVATLPEPVKFRSMSSPDEWIDVRLVLLMAVSDPAQQVPTLGWIAKFIQNQELIAALVNAQDAQAAMCVLQPVVSRQTL